MLSISTNLSRPRVTQTHTEVALRIVDCVEREVERQEFIFGPGRLLRTVDSFDSNAYHTHTAYYRRVIRETTWPHGKWVGGTHADFLRGFEYSSLGYVWAGFEALEFFGGKGELAIEDVYEDALVAESLRGQFGKSSPDGLDRRLEGLEDRFLKEFGDEDDLVILCTPIEPVRPAETALMDDFANFRKIFPTPPTIDDVLGAADHNRATVWRFLRRYVRWRVNAVAPLYDGIRSASSADRTAANIEHLHMRRNKVLARLPGPAASLVDSILSLNVLNLILEPAFSFKGCVGFPLGMVFRCLDHVAKRPALDQLNILFGKMNLFTMAQQRRDLERS
jgi:hypothetical protein